MYVLREVSHVQVISMPQVNLFEPRFPSVACHHHETFLGPVFPPQMQDESECN